MILPLTAGYLRRIHIILKAALSHQIEKSFLLHEANKFFPTRTVVPADRFVHEQIQHKLTANVLKQLSRTFVWNLSFACHLIHNSRPGREPSPLIDGLFGVVTLHGGIVNLETPVEHGGYSDNDVIPFEVLLAYEFRFWRGMGVIDRFNSIATNDAE
jgi:hypothetical protein